MSDKPQTREHALEILSGYPADVLAVAANGHVTRADYEEVLIPAVEAKIKSQGRVKMIYVVGEGFAGYSAGAVWDDAKLGFLHLGDFARVAVVTDTGWIASSVRLFAPLVRCPVHVFPLSGLDAARAWIAEDRPPPAAGPEVDATHKLPLAEDRLPPDP